MDNELMQIKTPITFKIKKQLNRETLDTNSLFIKYLKKKNIFVLFKF